MTDNAGKNLPRTDELIEIEDWKLVKIQLSDLQREAIKRVTGEDLLHLRIVVRDLLDLGDLVAN